MIASPKFSTVSSSKFSLGKFGVKEGCKYWLLETKDGNDFIGEVGGDLSGSVIYQVLVYKNEYPLKEGKNGPECDLGSKVQETPSTLRGTKVDPRGTLIYSSEQKL